MKYIDENTMSTDLKIVYQQCEWQDFTYNNDLILECKTTLLGKLEEKVYLKRDVHSIHRQNPNLLWEYFLKKEKYVSEHVQNLSPQ